MERHTWGCRSTGGRLVCIQQMGVRFPSAPRSVFTACDAAVQIKFEGRLIESWTTHPRRSVNTLIFYKILDVTYVKGWTSLSSDVKA